MATMTYKELLHGIITPVITPMDEKENICEEQLRVQIDRLIEAGVHGIFAFGTNGEGYILSREEKERVLSIVIEQTAGRVPVYAGTGCISTRETIELSVKAQELGADVLSVITPSFAAASQEELYQHYKAVAESVSIPVVLYNIPARTGNALSPATVERLSRLEHIAGVKDSSGNFDNILQYIERTLDRDFAVLSGNDSLILWTLFAGGTGGIAGCSNVYPETLASIYNSFVSGNFEEAKRCQNSIRTLRNCFQFGNPNTVIKEAVGMLGYPVGHCRRPFHMLSEEGRAALKQVLDENAGNGMK